MPTIDISGMSCKHCTASVTKTLQSLPGVTNVYVTLSPGQASFDATPEVAIDMVKEAIRKIGFTTQE